MILHYFTLRKLFFAVKDFSNFILVSDYDRTMTAISGEVPLRNLQAADEFIARGGAFTIATGRSKPMFELPLRGLRLNAPALIANGAAVWDTETGELSVRRPFPPGALDAAWELHLRFPQLRMEFEGLQCHDCFGPDPLREAYLNRYGVMFRYPDFDGIEPDVLSVTYYAPFRAAGHVPFSELDPVEEQPFDELEEIVRREFLHFFTPVRSMPRMLELIPAGCGKGEAARELAASLERPVLLCAGDAPNDLDMLEVADRAFIPENAAPGLFGRGFEVVDSCDKGTVAAAIALLLKDAV